MSLSSAFLDQLRTRTSLSALIGARIKITKAGREYKACCPFHGEKTPSFTINDDKGFYHCFGCGAHGDAIGWLVDHENMAFMDAVRELAARAGVDVPARSPEAAQRMQAAEDVHGVLAAAGAWYAAELATTPAAVEQLHDRGVSAAAIARFGLGLAPSRKSVAACGQRVEQLAAAGVMMERDDGYRDRFLGRIMIPIHDARGRHVGFGARATRAGQDPKYMNTPDAAHFDKGRLLFNHHRAAPAARAAKRLIVVEGYFDVVALDSAGISEAVAPMGTALTEGQLERAWRLSPAPILLFDGDAAGRKAALRACERALPAIGTVFAGNGLPASLSVAILPDGSDPDDLVRRPVEEGGGRAGIDAVIAAAMPISDYLWAACLDDAPLVRPEAKAGLWKRLAALAGTIGDDETRAQYLSEWRGRFDAAFPPPPPWARDIETLPIGRLEAFEEQPEAVQARLRAIAAAWFEQRLEYLTPEKDAILRLAFTAGRRVGAGLLAESEVKEKLWAQYELLPDVSHADVDTALGDGTNRAWDIGPDLVTLRCAGFPMTDFGIGERFIARHGENFRFTTAKGWLGWDERRWRVLDQEKDGPPPAELQTALFETVRAIQDEARAMRRTGFYAAEQNPSGMDQLIPKGKSAEALSSILARFGRQSESAGKPGAIAKLAQRWLTVPIEHFDMDPLAINVLNGTLRFVRTKDEDGRRRASVTLEAHSRADLNTKLAPVEYDPDALSPIYDDFLAWAQPDPAMRRYLHQWAGYSASGDVSEQKLQFWYGLGANGKSTTIDLWAYVVGDYSGSIGIETFLDQGIKKRGEQASPDLARLGGVRLLRASEPERGAKLNEALIKAATGGEPMAVRALHRGFFDLQPLFKLTIGGNYKPQIPGTDEGIWRRMKLVPWLAHVADADRDEALPFKLRSEAAGVLNHIVRGLLDWLVNGLVEPEAVREATAQYREESDPLGRFLADCTVPDPGGRIQSSHLHAVFVAWAKAAGEKEWTNKGMSGALTDRGVEKKNSNGVQFLGLRLVREASDFVDEKGQVRDVLPGSPDDPPSPPPSTYHPPPDDDYVPGFDD